MQGAAAAQSVSEEGAASVPTRPAHGPGDGILPLAKPGCLLPPVSLNDGARRPRGPGSGGRLWEPASTRPAPAFHPGLSDGGGGGGPGRAEPPVDVDRVPLGMRPRGPASPLPQRARPARSLDVAAGCRQVVGTGFTPHLSAGSPPPRAGGSWLRPTCGRAFLGVKNNRSWALNLNKCLIRGNDPTCFKTLLNAVRIL